MIAKVISAKLATGALTIVRWTLILALVAPVWGSLPQAGVHSAQAALLDGIYFADAAANPGAIYHLENDGSFSLFYSRRAGALSHFAISPDETIYYSYFNDSRIYMYSSITGEAVYYTHDTYVRDLAFGPDGLVYFSNASGGGGDGQIWRLIPSPDGADAELVYEVPLSEVDNFWRGDFTFGEDSFLFLSSGNTVPARLYRVDPAEPATINRIYWQNEEMDGIAQDEGGVTFFTTRVGGIYRMESGLPRELVWDIPASMAVWDLNVVGLGPITSARMFVYPASAAPGAKLRLKGFGFPGGATLDLTLEHLEDGTQTSLGSEQTLGSGELQTTTILPIVDPGLYDLFASLSGELLATAPVDVQTPLDLTISPQSGPPGSQVNFTVTELLEGELQINFDGEAVWGPAAVSSGAFSGSFIVPNDRPEPLGNPTSVQALNLHQGQIIGQAQVSFQSQTSAPVPIYSLTNLQIPIHGVGAGETFIITGNIDPTPEGSLDKYHILPIWKTASGKTFPIGSGPPQIELDGSFEIPAHMPSLLLGDPAPPEDGDQIGLVLFSPENDPATYLQPGNNPWDYYSLKVKVVDKETNQTIPGALVSLVPWQNQYNAKSINEIANTSAFTDPNQIADLLGIAELTEEEEWMIKLVKLMCAPQPIPANEDPLELINPALQDSIIQAPFESLIQQSTLIQSTMGFTSASLSPTSVEAIPSNWIHYLLTVDALDQGYGTVDYTANTLGVPKTFSMHVYYNPSNNTYHNSTGALLPNPYTVKLDKLPSGLLSEVGPIEVFFEGLLPKDSGYPHQYGDYYSLKNIPSGTVGPSGTQAGLLVVLTTNQYHKLSSQGMKLYLDGGYVDDIFFKFNPGINCSKFKGAQQVSQPFYEGTATIPNPHMLAAGVHPVTLETYLKGGEVTEYQYDIHVSDLPASWFATPVQGQRVVSWTPGEVTLRNPWLTGTGSYHLLTSGNETDETGPLDNTTQADVSFCKTAESSGYKGNKTNGSTQGQAINKSGVGVELGSFSPCAPNTITGFSQAGRVNSVLDATIPYGPESEVLVPEIVFNIPEAKAGIPFVAEVGAGGSLKYSASVTYFGSVTIKDDASVSSLVEITPVSNIGASMYISGYLLGGVLAHAKTTLDVNMHLGMPITYTTEAGMDSGKECFTYQADLIVWGGMVCVPYTDICAFEDSDVNNLFSDEEPDGCTLPKQPQAAQYSQATAPPMGDMDFASNGYGTVMALWQESKTSLASSLYNGVDWSQPQSISTGWGSHGPQVAFMTPNHALAVWTDTNLPGDNLPGIGLNDAIQSQYLAYAEWDGLGWSAPQTLTAPSLGEGGVALSACPASDPACPPGGAITAVWERNLSTDLNARQIRLYHATFQDGMWSSPQPVDPSSTATDILPAVAYVNGTPLIAWVRDSDSDLKDVSSRRIALRFLGSGAVSIPGNLPNSIAEVALAVEQNGAPALAFTRAEVSTQLMSNRRPLWVAEGSCIGSNCTWTPRQLRDPFDRTIYAEQPQLEFDANQEVLITFRGIGFGPDSNGKTSVQPGDPPGMVSGSGDLLKVSTDFSANTVVPAFLTSDGAVNWQPAGAYDPLLGTLLTSAVKGALPTSLAQTPALFEKVEEASPDPSLPLAFDITPELPDFSIVTATLSTRYPQPGHTLTATVELHNRGAFWPGSEEQPLEVLATWDGGPGLGMFAGQTNLTALRDLQFAEVEINITLPVGSFDEVHTLTITVNPGLSIGETDTSTNQVDLEVGGLPTPFGLSAKFKPFSGLTFLNWEPLTDDRLAGYRVYRSQDGGPYAPVGSSFISAFVDLNALPGSTYEYRISAFSDLAMESALSDAVTVDVKGYTHRIYLPITSK